MPMSHAPMNELNAFGSLQRAVLIPEAAPRSSFTTNPIIIDCSNGLDIFMRKARTVYMVLASTILGENGVRNINNVEVAWVVTTAFTNPNFFAR